jgi:hypothetical protein
MAGETSREVNELTGRTSARGRGGQVVHVTNPDRGTEAAESICRRQTFLMSSINVGFRVPRNDARIRQAGAEFEG